ncbi:MAG: hypothetical protein AVDCRST_MAG87-1890 [uncultured Thermomicrobiales bacterium]|uniref:J domain-containing protein n=1 Tax=uncultured Thermomicrobiales bacterium TaxID=1645740 RepID=A0A6J4UZU4_9BACT|nr:MAG: hypothetical protein AVDCRST_MAG87-1890 [uncultured Thermomicrobiales bacterium]
MINPMSSSLAPTPETPTFTRISTVRTALVPLPDRAEAEYAALRAEIEFRAAVIARLEAEIAPVTAALEKFEWEYRARLGGLQAELRAIRDLIATLEDRTVRIHARMVADPNGMLGDLFDREELRQIGEMFGIEIPASWFRAADHDEQRERESDWRFFGRDRDDPDPAQAEERRRLRWREKRRLPKDTETELRTLFRSLARRFHPDLCDSEHDRQRRQEMMHRINEAWHEQDLQMLQHIDRESAHEGGRDARASFAERVLWARAECGRLDARIDALTRQLGALRASDTFPLWFNPSLGNSVITQRATALRIDIATAHHQADEVKAAFRQALRYYATAMSA